MLSKTEMNINARLLKIGRNVQYRSGISTGLSVLRKRQCCIVDSNENIPPRIINAKPNQEERLCGGRCSLAGTKILRNNPKRSIMKPKAISARQVRFQAIKVRSAANNTRGSLRSDIGKWLLFFYSSNRLWMAEIKYSAFITISRRA